MSADSGIEWTRHTFNPWWGCTKVSPGCDNCYAEAFDHRLGGAHWGKGSPRRPASESYWGQPLKWNAAAARAGERQRVFCASMADVFDAEAPVGAIERLWGVIRATPHLDWLLLSKRPARIRRGLPPDWGDGYVNVWLGTTVEDQERARVRILELADVPARVRFLSCEPLIGPVDLARIEVVAPKPPQGPGVWLNALTGHVAGPDDMLGRIHWVIIGGESGPGARPFALAWARSLIQQCRQAGAACFVKQLGAKPVGPLVSPWDGRKGSDWKEWPHDLRIREFPAVLP